MIVFHCGKTGVTVDWKQVPVAISGSVILQSEYKTFAPSRTDARGIVHGKYSFHTRRDQALAEAQRISKDLIASR